MCAVTSSHSREIDPDMPRAWQPNIFLSFTAKDWETLGKIWMVKLTCHITERGD